MSKPSVSPALVLFALIAQLALAAGAPAQAPEAADLEFELPSDTLLPFLVMRQLPAELAGEHAVEHRVFADGRCEVERPPIMRGAGRREWRMSPTEVRDLAQQALAAGVADLDARAARASLRAAAKSDAAQSLHRLDDDVVEFELRLDRYVARRGATARAVDRRLRWAGLRGDRARHPGDDRVRRLSELRDTLEAMAETRAPRAPTPPQASEAP